MYVKLVKVHIFSQTSEVYLGSCDCSDINGLIKVRGKISVSVQLQTMSTAHNLIDPLNLVPPPVGFILSFPEPVPGQHCMCCCRESFTCRLRRGPGSGER